jgi:hypothetical protein
MVKRVSAKTQGGARGRRFGWWVSEERLILENENRLKHEFLFVEIYSLLQDLKAQFGSDWIPLANNVEKLYRVTEVFGLGSAIYARCPGDTLHAQGASYLGVVLEQCGLFRWNGQVRGIAWSIVETPATVDALKECLSWVTASA